MALVTPSEAEYPSLIALAAARMPYLPRSELDFPVMVPVFQPDVVVRAAVDEHGDVLGWGWIAALDVFPPGWSLLHVVVAADHEGRGVGSQVHRALLEAMPAGTTSLRSQVTEEDPRTHGIAAHWGYELVQRSIASRLALDAPARPELSVGLTIDVGLDISDPEAVERMLVASQTNPEAAYHLHDLAEVHNTLAKIPNPLALVARADGVPAGILYGGVPDGTLLVLYAGVDPAYRGRGIAKLLKLQAHVEAAARGATQVLTQNEEHNAGIRRINAELGFEQLYVEHRLQRAP